MRSAISWDRRKTVHFAPYALADHEEYSERAGAAFARFGATVVGLHTFCKSQGGAGAGRGPVRRRRQQLPPVEGASRSRPHRSRAPPSGGGRVVLHGLQRRHQHGVPDDPDDQRHADRRTTLVRSLRPDPVPDQSPLPRPGPRFNAHGRDTREADPPVSRRERCALSWECARAHGCEGKAQSSSVRDHRRAPVPRAWRKRSSRREPT